MHGVWFYGCDDDALKPPSSSISHPPFSPPPTFKDDTQQRRRSKAEVVPLPSLVKGAEGGRDFPPLSTVPSAKWVRAPLSFFVGGCCALSLSLSLSSHVVGGKEDDDGRTDVGRAKRLPPPPPPSSRTLTFSPADRLRSCFSRDLRLAERGREGNRSRSPRR